MKLRIAWLGDGEFEDSYSAREARILMRGLARWPDIVPLWFAVGSSGPPHLWGGIRVFPVPKEALGSETFLQTLMAQQRPSVVLSNLPAASVSRVAACLNGGDVCWAHRISPADLKSGWIPEASVILVGEESLCANFKNGRFVPYIKGLDPAVGGGADSTAVLERLTKTVVNGRATRSPASSGRQRCLVMRQQLYANCSSAQAMFELTNALLETGIPTVPQEEHMIFSSESVQREEDMFRLGAMEKYERLRRNLAREHDPESAITIHSALLKSGHDCLRCGAFPSLGGQEVLYVSGNQMVRREEVQAILEAYDMVLAPSQHVLTAYLQAGLPRRRGAVIPYGIDPAVYSPEMEPFHYPTRKQFKFLHTSFPWVQEKGFDLTIQAFGRAFSGRDDVSLILRVPKIRDPGVRKSGFDRLDALVKEALAKPDAPEILLMEMDVEPNRRASFYTGADCYVHPLRSEGFGMTILEAMACGLPVIATAWSGPADFLLPQWAYTLRHSSPRAEKAQDGTILRHYVEPELDHLVDLMRHAYEQEAEGKALGQMASAVVRARWTWQHGAARLASLFGLTPQGESATAEFELQQARGHDSRH